MNTNSNTYTVVYSTILVMVVAAVLAFAASSLKSRQEDNVKAETISKIITAAGLYEEGCDAKAVYAQNLVEAFLVDAAGEPVGQLAEGEVKVTADLKIENDNIKAGKSVKLPVYKFNVNNEVITVLPCYGAGLWGPIWGYVALKPDMNTIAGVVFDHKGETPGLGAKIATEPWFREQFEGKQIAKNGEVVAVSIVKGGAPKGDINAVDAISGATITSQALDATLKIWLGQYKEYIAKCPQPAGNVSETSENQED